MSDGHGSATDGAPLTEKHYSRAQVNQVTQSEQQHMSPGRHFSMFSIVGLAYAILNSWTAMAASLSVALPSGGPTAVIWGIVPSFIGNLCMALSMAEICHTYPTSGGQYHWSAVLSPAKRAPLVSYICGWFSVAGWWALTATAGSLAGSLITGAYALKHPEYEGARYQTFIVYVGYTIIACLLNIYGLRLLPLLNKAAISWSLAGAATIAVVCLACQSGNYQPASFVFGEYINETGWNNGVAWILGLLQSSFGLTAYDAVSHMVEEMPNPHRNAPLAMVLAVIIGSVSSFIFLICLLFSITDVNALLESSAGALIGAIYQATGNVAGTLCLSVFPIVSMMFAAQGILTGASRMTHAFSRDGGLPFSKFFSKTNDKTGVPDRCVVLVTVLVIIFGCIYLGSSAALNAILSSSVVFLNVSYCIPIALLLFRGRHLLHPPSFPAPTHSLGRFWGPLVNVVGLAFTALTTVFFVFPPDLPVDALNMNYAVAVFGLIAIVAAVLWVTVAHKDFIGPRDLGGLLELARAEVDSPVATRFPADGEKQVGQAIVE